MHITHRLLTIATAALALLLPAAAFAMPANVTGVELEKTATGALVTWDAVGGAETYKIFWSRESILENDALFDDMIETENADTTYALGDLPAMDDLYVAVLAVDANGDESPLFEEEAHLVLKPTTVASSSAASVAALPLPSTTAPEILRALKVDVPSETTVIVTFSAPVVLDQQSAKTAFVIKDGIGQILQISRIKAEGMTVELTTQPQAKQRAYRLHIDPSLKGRTAAGDSVLTLDAQQTDLLFLGNIAGAENVQQPVASGAPDVQQVQVQASADGVNTYTIDVTWQLPQGASIAGYRISQTRDGGATYSNPQALAATVQAVRIPKAGAGELGLLIQTTDASGAASRGVLQRIILPATSGRAVQGTVLPPRSTPVQNMPLPQTGAGTISLLAIAGAYAGAQLQRRKMVRA